MLEGVVGQGLALANLLSLIFITPVVTFYLLRDWDRLVARLDELLPRDHAAVIRAAGGAGRPVAGGLRARPVDGVPDSRRSTTAIALTDRRAAVRHGGRLDRAGLLAFIPYVGSLTGFVVSMAIAIGQFDDPWPVVVVAVIFGMGQVLEGNFLTPKLVGDRVGLHPVWIIFALLSGGALFGFVGAAAGGAGRRR